MKTYNHQEAVETLFGLLVMQDKQTLAKELAKIMAKQEKGWVIKDIDISLVRNDHNTYVINIGGQT